MAKDKIISQTVSDNGIPIQYVVKKGEEKFFLWDENACYIDSTLDCFRSWNGKGSLKKWIVCQFEKESAICSRLLSEPQLTDSEKYTIEYRRQMLGHFVNDIKTESDKALRHWRKDWLNDPNSVRFMFVCDLQNPNRLNEATVAEMVAMAH